MTIERFKRAATDAIFNDSPMRIVLKGGETLEGVLERVVEDASKTPASFSPPIFLGQEPYSGPEEFVVTISGKEILAQEVAEFAVLDRSRRDG
jgi:hypothetical protein